MFKHSLTPYRVQMGITAQCIVNHGTITIVLDTNTTVKMVRVSRTGRKHNIGMVKLMSLELCCAEW